MLQVKHDGQIQVATFSGMASKPAVVDCAGKRYALLQNSGTGQLCAWSGNTDENAVDCVLVTAFPGELTGTETLLEELAIVGDIRQGNAVLTKDAAGYHMRDARNLFGRFRHDLPADTDAARVEAHWAGFAANVRAA